MFYTKYKIHNTKYFHGFTLIEMLIVITIIALLASTILVGMGSARAKARDSRRIADLHNVQNALELYYANKSQYPPVSPPWTNLQSELAAAGITSKIPQDPVAGQTYHYCPTSTYLSYILAAQLETDDSALDQSVSGSCGGLTCGRTNKVYCISPD